MKTLDIDWRLKYLHPSLLSFASGANLVGYLYDHQIGLLLIAAISMMANIWIVSENIEDDKNGI